MARKKGRSVGNFLAGEGDFLVFAGVFILSGGFADITIISTRDTRLFAALVGVVGDFLLVIF